MKNLTEENGVVSAVVWEDRQRNVRLVKEPSGVVVGQFLNSAQEWEPMFIGYDWHWRDMYQWFVLCGKSFDNSIQAALSAEALPLTPLPVPTSLG